MTLNELKNLIKAGDVEVIRLYGQLNDGKMIWLVAAHGKPSVYAFSNTLTNSSRDKHEREYTSLDRAYAAIKKAGYQGRFEVDDGSCRPIEVKGEPEAAARSVA
jgi:hypothetical protein